MSWRVWIRRGSKLHSHEVDDLAAAIAVACVLMQEDIEIDRIEGQDGLSIDADMICSELCRAPCSRNRRRLAVS